MRPPSRACRLAGRLSFSRDEFAVHPQLGRRRSSRTSPSTCMLAPAGAALSRRTACSAQGNASGKRPRSPWALRHDAVQSAPSTSRSLGPNSRARWNDGSAVHYAFSIADIHRSPARLAWSTTRWWSTSRTLTPRLPGSSSRHPRLERVLRPWVLLAGVRAPPLIRSTRSRSRSSADHARLAYLSFVSPEWLRTRDGGNPEPGGGTLRSPSSPGLGAFPCTNFDAPVRPPVRGWV